MKVRTIGWIRSGTSWIRRLLIHYFDDPSLPAWSFLSHGNRDDFVHTHEMNEKIRAEQLQNGTRIVYVFRDPRDTAISSYYFHYNNPQLSNPQPTLLEYLQTYFSRHQVPAGDVQGWLSHMEKWLAMQDTIYAQHEKLYDNREWELRRIVSELGVMPEQDRIDFAVRQSFMKTAWRPVYEDPSKWRNEAHVVPSGKPGEWKKHFGKTEIAFMRSYCGDLMEKLGYEW